VPETAFPSSCRKDIKFPTDAFLDKIEEIEHFLARADDGIRSTLNGVIDSPEQMMQTYDVVSAMQRVYHDMILMAEDWTCDFNDWVLQSLRSNMSLPIERPDILSALVQCLRYERKLHSPETIEVIQQVIDKSLDFQSSSGVVVETRQKATLETVLNAAVQIMETLHNVDYFLVPLLGEDINVMEMYQMAAEQRMKQHIIGFYTVGVVAI
jgi:hypothetical protein